ncbi:PP2C family protein-serine/threonine phosphatase [Streptomyces sp. NPDC004589]|uniref:PP2C family protein-serine/threonine phosphatase n=1 Tax=Streptomyces sp. NPDC004589 TaxID=3154553 RepID=UPI0033B90B7E
MPLSSVQGKYAAAVRIARAFPAALILGGVAADLFAPEPYVGLPLLAAAPLVGCTVLRTWVSAAATAVAACLASIGVDVLIGRPASATFVDFGVVLLIGLVGLWVNRLMSLQTGRLIEARDIAEAAQRAVVPVPPTQVGALSVVARYEAAQAEAKIGGDLYAVQESPFGVRAIVGDVVGKGMRAVPAVSAVLGTFREAAESSPDLVVLAQRLEHALERDCHAMGEGSECLTTALLVEIPAEGGSVSLLSKGHPAPFLLQGGKVTRLEPTAPDLPLGTGLSDAVQGGTPSTFPLAADATLLMVTDGVLEARNHQGAFYDPAPTLSCKACAHPGDIVDSLVLGVSQWTDGERQDDLAVLALSCKPAAHSA